MKIFRTYAMLSILLFFLATLSHVRGDRGGFSPYPKIDHVSESGQKAVIAWNGTHEILTLSTDVSSSEETEVVELMPLPSNPAIYMGEKQSFLKVQGLVNMYFVAKAQAEPKFWSILEYRGSRTASIMGEQTQSVTIKFQEVIGAHFLTVVEVEEASELVQWLEIFLETKGHTEELPLRLEELCSHYVEDKMNFFVIDMITTNSTVKTVEPLVYEFKSSILYYPLLMSSLFSGDTDISLFTITNNELNDNLIIKEGFVKKAQFQITQETLADININMTKVFSTNPYLCYFKFKGALNSFEGDILADFKTDVSAIALSVVSIGSGLVILTLLLPISFAGRLLHGKRSIFND